MQPSAKYDYCTLPRISGKTNYQSKWIDFNIMKTNKYDLEYLLDRSARKLRYKSKRTKEYVHKLNDVIIKLNGITFDTLVNIPSHIFYYSIRNIIRDLLLDWHFSSELTEEETYLLRNSILFFDRLVNIINDVTKLTLWLIEPSLINSLADCMSDIDQLLYDNRQKQNFKQLIRLFDIFNNYYQRLPVKFQNEDGLYALFKGTMDCLVSSKYERAFKKLKPDAESMTNEQKFFLIKCPSFFSSYRGSQSSKVIEQLLDTMVPRYASLIDKHIHSINEWKSPMIHAVHHLLLTVIYARGYYAPYATGQPLQWLIDHIVHIINEPSFITKVNEKATNPETLLIHSALRTLTAFVHEPDLLVYIKQLKITSIFRSLILLPNESIVLHAYVMLSYTLEENDIKASEKDSGRLLSKIFDSLRKKTKSLSVLNKNEEITERNISLLTEALQVLVQHDQIKTEILKQNALPLLVNSCQHFNDQSKRLVLESLGSISFDVEAARLLRDNKQFIKSMEDMQKTTDDGIRKAAEKIVWNLQETEREKKLVKEKFEFDYKKETDSKIEKYQYDIMISYCHADKELVCRIYEFLSDKGFKIWFDRDNIYGPAMQSMATAVENAEYVILCMSDSYKRSVYCQAEAEYAFRCKRRLLPIIVRQGYRADGWLGILLGTRIYIDFGRLEFKTGCELIVKEISLQRENPYSNNEITSGYMSSDENTHDFASDIMPLTRTLSEMMEKSRLPEEYTTRNTLKATYRSISINRWTRKDVLDFLYDTNLHYMMPLCEFMTGYGLIKLFRICQTKPNQFYCQLNEELNARFGGLRLPLGVFTEFLSEIDRLIDSASIKDIEQDAFDSRASLTSRSSSLSPTSTIIKHYIKTSRSSSLLEPLQKPDYPPPSISSPVQTISPTLTIIQSQHIPHVTEQTNDTTEALTPSLFSYVESLQATFSTRSK
ncbi:unnamed protein product [Adineta steineri]|uniref:TIR domain-containing protein n=2 Tax=Adineta steineri TaxID=433720 RepID=A0A814PJE7_9BILA|nr:unnamed protein product [Adineta steineri]CAF1106711.1 unnamed protein product [Adineta steineri]